MNLATLMIQNSYSAELFSFQDSGDTFKIIAKQTQGNVRTGRVQLLIKANKERAQQISMVSDDWNVEAAIDFVKTELLSVEVQ